MQSIKVLTKWLSKHASEQRHLFLLSDLRALYPHLSDSAFKTLLSRAVSSCLLSRACRGVYLFEEASPADGLLLFRIAALMRANNFNYISLETALSDVGVISQVPFNWVSIMSSGRSNLISCGKFGSIEFIHTKQSPTDLVKKLSYDSNCGLWRASVALALNDMKRTHRDCDLIDWELANELI